MSPTQRALKEARKMGYIAEVTEQWNAFAKIRIDLFSCIDIIAIKPGLPILGIQATSHSNLTSRVNKCIKFGHNWLATGHAELECWAFRKLKGHRALQLDRRVVPKLSSEEYAHRFDHG